MRSGKQSIKSILLTVRRTQDKAAALFESSPIFGTAFLVGCVQVIRKRSVLLLQKERKSMEKHEEKEPSRLGNLDEIDFYTMLREMEYQ